MDIVLEGTGYAGKTTVGKTNPYYVSEVSKGFGNVARKILRQNEFFDTKYNELETILLAIDWNIKQIETCKKKHRIFDRGLYSIVAYQTIKKYMNFGTSLESAFVETLQTCGLVTKMMGNKELISKTILLTVNKPTLIERYKLRNGKLREKSVDILMKIQDFYIEFKPDSWIQIDTSEKTIEELSGFIKKLIH